MKKDPIDVKTSPASERIIVAARKLFIEKGFAGTSMRDIGREAGLNPAAVNYYFHSKGKLLELIINENLLLFIREVAGHLGNEQCVTNGKGDIVSVVNLHAFAVHPDLLLFILQEVRVNPLLLSDETRKEMHAVLSRMLDENLKAGKIDRNDFLLFIATLVRLTLLPLL